MLTEKEVKAVKSMMESEFPGHVFAKMVESFMGLKNPFYEKSAIIALLKSEPEIRAEIAMFFLRFLDHLADTEIDDIHSEEAVGVAKRIKKVIELPSAK